MTIVLNFQPFFFPFLNPAQNSRKNRQNSLDRLKREVKILEEKKAMAEAVSKENQKQLEINKR